MDGLQILETIRKINPWFKTKVVPSSQLEEFKRREFSALEKDLNVVEMAMLVIGGRRVGKSVLMYQLIDKLLKAGTDSKKILFIQGDNPILNEFIRDGKVINLILEIYQKYILEAAFDEVSDRIYIFIDEAQNLPNWELEVKALIDLKYSIKFVVTGSSSRELRQGAQNPLTGRVNIHTITPFSFADFVRYNIRADLQIQFNKRLAPLAKKFKESLMSANIQDCYNQAKAIESILTEFLGKNRLEQYLLIGGFPWVIAHQTGDDIAKYLRDLLTTTISKDILTQVEIRDTQAFERLMVNLCIYAGKPVKYKNFADTLGLDERSVARYVDYYVESHWAFISSQFLFHKKIDSVKTDKKIYVIDSGVMNTLVFKDALDLKTDRQYRGQVLENVIHNHLLSFRQNLFGSFQNYIPFWSDEQSGREIDFILEIKNGVLPIEVKSKLSIDEDLSTLETFVKDHASAKFGIITSEDTLEIRNNILIIPYISLLLLL